MASRTSAGAASALGLSAPVARLRGVGERLAARLARLDIHTVRDLLLHLPLRYQDRTRITPIGALRPGDEGLIRGEVLLTEVRPGRRRMLLSRLGDGTGVITIRFFHFTPRLRSALTRGVWLRCYGEVRQGATTLELVHPEYQFITTGDGPVADDRLTPVYPATAGLSQPVLRAVIAQALALLDAPCGPHPGGDPDEMQGGMDELLPREIRVQYRLPSLGEAVRYLHRPPPDACIGALLDGSHPMRKRLAFEELLAHQLSLRLMRAGVQRQPAPPFEAGGTLVQRFIGSLPFPLTGAQRRVIDEITRDLRRARPMQRLIQGDVGSGKTVVAAAALLIAVEAGYQGALMAPTELLAEQHYRNLEAWLKPLGVGVTWLAGRSGRRGRREALTALREGHVAVAVGTHALFQEEVVFRSLGLIVVDEQHRFGVHQRLTLREKGRCEGRCPHQLIMTATPIPRTLMMAAYADLDCSVIDELPPGRQPVTTVIVPDSRRAEVVERVREVCRQGRQAYWVCTLIDDSEALQCQAALETAEALARALPELRVGLVHGRMKPREKEREMAAFKDGAIQLLVATTVIEVGVDVPNASLMIIENAERLGLAQLHQLRGRVGRGAQKSVCVLMYHSPLSERGRARLAILRETGDGFEIARHDLRLRGPGEILGTRQAGVARLRVADLSRDQDLIVAAGEVAQRLLESHPERVAAIVRRWLGERPRYATV